MDLLKTKYTKNLITYEGLARKEKNLYPELALREALMNAVAHKDYSSGNPIQISVYDDQILFYNDAIVPDDIDIEKLRQKHPSRPHNPNIANVLFRAGLIEAWGRGTIKIIYECKNNNNPEPEFNITSSSFNTNLFSNHFKGSDKSSDKSSERKEFLSEKEIEILREINNNPKITILKLSEKFDLSTRMIEKKMKKFKDKKYLERIGGKRYGYWDVKFD